MADATNVPKLKKAARAFGMHGLNYFFPAIYMLIRIYTRSIGISHTLSRDLSRLRNNQTTCLYCFRLIFIASFFCVRLRLFVCYSILRCIFVWWVFKLAGMFA